MRFWKWRKQGLNFAREHSSRCTQWRHFGVDLPSETGDTRRCVWGKILKLERGHGSSTCNLRKDCNMSFDTTPFVKMIRGVDSSVSAKRSAEGCVKVWLCLLLAVLFIGSVRVQQSTESQQFLSNYLHSLQSSEWVTNKERCVIESRLSVWTVENIYHANFKKMNFRIPGQFSSRFILSS